MDEIGNNPAAIHALWILNGLNALDGSDQNALTAVNQALTHPAPAVRKTAVQVMPSTGDVAGMLLKANMLNDKEPLVVLNTILALSKLPSNPATDAAVLARLTTNAGEQEVNDRWLPDAFSSMLTSQNGRLLKTYVNQLAVNAPAKAGQAMSAHNHADMAKSPAMVMTASTASTPPSE